MQTSFSPGRTSGIVVFGLAVALAGALTARAQAPPSLPNPRLNWVFPAGGKQGTTFEVSMDGFDLDEPGSLHFDNPGITSALKLGEPGLGQTGPQPVPNVFNVTIKPEVKPGIYEVRAVGKYGISSPRAFVVGTQPEIKETEPNNTLEQAQVVPLGTTINGNTKETATDYFKFSGKQGQRIIVDCWAFRIDSNVDATLVLYNSEGKELERNRNTNRRDPLLDFTVPRDGDYIVTIYDYLYGYSTLPAECFYRLTISTTPYLDFIFPPAGLPGSQSPYTLYGRNLPGGQPVPGLRVGGKTLEKLTVNIALPVEQAERLNGDLLVDPSEAFIDGIEYRLDSPQGMSNPLLVSVAGAPVVVEAEPNNDPAQAFSVKPPCEIAGQFYPRDDRDWVTFQAKKGEVYWIEVFSQRLGLPTDPFLLVQQIKKDDKGVEQAIDLQGVDDMEETSTLVHWSFLSGLLFNTATHDPAYRLVAPEDGTYRVLVRDLTHGAAASPRSVYRLLIRPPQPDFRLVAVPRPPTKMLPEQGLVNVTQNTTWSPLLRRGGAELIEIFAIRRDGFEGEIRVSAGNLPAGVTAAPVVLSAMPRASVEPLKRTTTLVLRADDNAPAGAASISITGKAKIGQAEVVHEARSGTMVWPTLPIGVTYPRSRLMHRLALSVVAAETAPFSLEVGPDLVLEASRFGTVKFPVNVVRRGAFTGSVALSVYGLPPIPSNQMHAQPLYTTAAHEIKANESKTEFALTIPYGAPTGTFSFFLSGAGTVNYARNPEAFKAAQDRKAAVEKIVADTAARAKAAAEAQAAAEKKRLEADATRLKAAADLKGAETAIAAAQATATAAQGKAVAAQAALAQDANNAGLATAKQVADQAASEANAKLKGLTDAKPALEKAVAATVDGLKAATEAKAAADKAVAETDAQAKQSAAFLQTFSLEVAKLQEKSKPADLMISVPTAPITLKITAAPFALEPALTAVTLKQGAKLDLPVSIKRLYGYADPVQLSLALPAGVVGISVPPAPVPAGQSQATLAIAAAPDATPGAHTVTLHVSAQYQGQNVSVSQEVPLSIEKMAPAR